MSIPTRFCALLLLPGLALFAQSKKTVFLITDAEGVAGICRQDQTEPTSPELRQLLTGEINAAVDGFYDGGADEVIVWDGHDGSQTLSALTIHPRARLIIGDLPASMLFERGFTAVALVGQHARADSRGGIMAHSYSSLGVQTMLLNGKPVGEIEVIAAIAGEFHTPLIFLSGDRAAASNLHDIVPQAETAVVKEGFSNYACLTLSAQASRDLIRAGAAQAMRRIADVKPYVVPGPVTFQVEFTTRNAIGVEVPRDAEMVDARTVRYHGKDVLEVWKRYRGR